MSIYEMLNDLDCSAENAELAVSPLSYVALGCAR